MEIKYVLPTTKFQRQILDELKSAKVPMLEKTDWQTGVPLYMGYAMVRIEKRGMFTYANARRITKNLANAALSCGVAYHA